MSFSFLQRPQSLSNEHGSGILILLMVMAFGFLLMIGNMQSQADASIQHLKGYKLQKRDVENFKAELNFILNSNAGCKANFAGLTIQASNVGESALKISQINYGALSSAPFVKADNSNHSRYGRSDVKSILLEAHPARFGAAGDAYHLANLKIHSVSPASEYNTIIPILLRTDAGGKILGCRSTTYYKKYEAKVTDQTFEEQLCNLPELKASPPSANWPADCLACMGSGQSYYYCFECRKQGKSYDETTGQCV